MHPSWDMIQYAGKSSTRSASPSALWSRDCREQKSWPLGSSTHKRYSWNRSLCVISIWSLSFSNGIVSSEDKAWILWMSLTYVLDLVPNSFLPLPVLLVFDGISPFGSQTSRCCDYSGHVKCLCSSRKCSCMYFKDYVSLCQLALKSEIECDPIWLVHQCPRLYLRAASSPDLQMELWWFIAIELEGLQMYLNLTYLQSWRAKRLKLLLEQGSFHALLGRREIHMDTHVCNFTQRCQIAANLVSMQTDIKCPLKSVMERNRSAQRFKARRRICQAEEKGRCGW